jgi:ADP-ribose pyrophosphatase
MNDKPGQPWGPWTILQSSQVYQDPWLQVRKDNVIRPDGHDGTYSVVQIRSGVTVLPVEKGFVWLTEEFHYAVGRVTLEAVSGGRDDSESALTCAKRELAEELGITAANWKELGTYDPFTGSVVSPTTLFIASELSFHTAAPEGTEQIRSVRMALKDAYLAVCEGRISHTPSCIAIPSILD